MSRLLNANFARLWKTKSFWICLAASFVYSTASILNICLGYMSSYRVSSLKGVDLGGFDFDYYLFENCTLILLLAAIFSALFVGVEHSDKTLRNKLVVGYARYKVYLANLLTTVFAVYAMLAVSFASVLGIGLSLGVGFKHSTGEIICRMGICLVTFAALCSINVMLAMLLTRRSSSIIITIVLTILMVFAAEQAHNKLVQREFEQWSEYDEESGEEILHTFKNPEYIGGTARDILTFFDNMLPENQIKQLQGGYRFRVLSDEDAKDIEHPGLMTLYSLGLVAVTTAAGAAVFRRKDLK